MSGSIIHALASMLLPRGNGTVLLARPIWLGERAESNMKYIYVVCAFDMVLHNFRVDWNAFQITQYFAPEVIKVIGFSDYRYI